MLSAGFAALRLQMIGEVVEERETRKSRL